MREGNQEAVLLALCSKTFTSKVIVFRFSLKHFQIEAFILVSATAFKYIYALSKSFDLNCNN